MFKKSIQKRRGFTLIELTLYVGIASIMLIVSSLLLSTLLQSRIKNQSIAEVNQQGSQILQTITQTLRNAKTINSPTIGTAAPTLSINDNNDIPILFYIENDTIMIREGTGSAIALNNSRVKISNLIFSNTSNSDTPGIIHVGFNLTYINTQNWNEYDFNRAFYASASLR